MTIGYSTAIRNAMLDAVTTAVGASGLLKLYNGTRPATGGTVTTLLSTLTGNATFAPGSSGGVLTLNAITQDSSAAASGTATWFRWTSSGATFAMDGDVGIANVTTVTGTSGAATVTVGSATGIIIGNTVSGTGIATGAKVVNISGTTITLSINNTGTVSGNGTFGFDLNMTNNVIAATQPVSCSSFVITEGNA